MYDYESLKVLAKNLRKTYHIKCSTEDLVVLATNNDPFYVGTETEKMNGKWFADIWERFGYITGVHLRRIHYQMISQETPILKPDGTPYINTVRCWEFLTVAGKIARYLEYVDAEAFIDKRNPPPVIGREIHGYTPSIYIYNPLEEIDDGFPDEDKELTFDLPEFPDYPAFPDLPSYEISDYGAQQKYVLEVWCEKSTMNDVLQPLCSWYDANLVVGLGEQSITATLDMVKRAMQYGKPMRVLYISDFDPAGKSMPVAVSRKAEYFIRKMCPDLDFRVFSIALTEEQVKQYRLPRTPIKESERRKARFEDVYGTGAVELDALEALHPGELGKLVRKHLERYVDRDLPSKVKTAYEELEEELEDVQDTVSRRFDSDIENLRETYNELSEIHATLKQQFDDILAEIQPQLEDLQNRTVRHKEQYGDVWETIAEAMEADKSDIDAFPVPEGEDADEIGPGLFDSTRSYEEQLLAYKAFQGKGNGRIEVLAQAFDEEDRKDIV